MLRMMAMSAQPLKWPARAPIVTPIKVVRRAARLPTPREILAPINHAGGQVAAQIIRAQPGAGARRQQAVAQVNGIGVMQPEEGRQQGGGHQQAQASHANPRRLGFQKARHLST